MILREQNVLQEGGALRVIHKDVHKKTVASWSKAKKAKHNFDWGSLRIH